MLCAEYYAYLDLESRHFESWRNLSLGTVLSAVGSKAWRNQGTVDKEGEVFIQPGLPMLKVDMKYLKDRVQSPGAMPSDVACSLLSLLYMLAKQVGTSLPLHQGIISYGMYFRLKSYCFQVKRDRARLCWGPF